MGVELGHLACILALALALGQGFYAFRGVEASSRPLLPALLNRELLCLGLAWLSLWYAFLVNDFSVSIVYAHSHHHLPWWYRLSALWGGHEGSVLLWVLLLSGWRWAFARFTDIDGQEKCWVHGVLAWISVGLLIFLLVSSNPFLRLLPNSPIEGVDLNPLLQDPGMAWHPPILYLGYVAFAIPYAFVLVMLWQQKEIQDWAAHLRPWVLLAWSALTVGIVLGSWWAYRELGWGGWWFWDPVENASLLPWLSGALLLHGLALVEKGRSAKAWTALVALMTFVLSLLGTFLVRSGVLISVHSFAQDPARGFWILALMVIYGGLAFALFAWRAHGLFQSKSFDLLTRSGAIVVNQLLLSTVLATVLLATLYPLIIEALGLGKISVGAPYFNQIIPILAIPMIAMLLVLPLLRWRAQKLVLPLQDMAYTLLIALVILIGIWQLWHDNNHVLAWGVVMIAVLGFAFNLWHIIKRYRQNQLSLLVFAMQVAHLGFLGMVACIGIAHSQSHELMVALQRGEQATIASYAVRYQGSEDIKSSNYHGVRADLLVSDGKRSWHYYPERRIYEASKTNLAKTAIMIRPTHDLFMAMGEPLQPAGWTFRLQYKPMLRGIWLFAMLMALAGLIAAFARRRAGHVD